MSLVVKLQAKSNTPAWCFSRFLNYTNDTKPLKASLTKTFDVVLQATLFI